MRKIHVQYYEGQNVGVWASFLNLIENALESEYYAFCDQDDVWDDNKLEIAVDMLENVEGPAIYSCKKRVVDEDLVVLCERGNFDPKTTLCSLARDSALTGCTMVYNKALMDLVKRHIPKTITMHDAWVRDICLCVGGRIIFDEIPHISYRQHDNNVVGGKKICYLKLRELEKALKF